MLAKEADPSWSDERLAGHIRDEHGTEDAWARLLAAALGERWGRKPVGRTASTGFQMGVRRTLPIARERVWELLMSREGLKLWIGELAPPEWAAGVPFESAEGTTGTMRVYKPYEQLRLTWKLPEWDKPSTLQIRLMSSSPDRTTVSFHQENLSDLFERERMLAKWEGAIASLREMAGTADA
ncbi:ATPase [Paenibacillus flagellatus]|uniref:ATPase n=2 Tax=Paenibacillus flagellatus TaxID=2211139 RepID=A0A2V5KD36_9BACL|nr:ATPase [Paenibacillus flagellatus]